MARSANDTAAILMELYDDRFGGGDGVCYRISWSKLRGITGLPRLGRFFLSRLERSLRGDGYLLVTLDDYFLIANEMDFDTERNVPQRLAESHRFDPADDEDFDDVADEIDEDVEDIDDL